jgi:acyl carrier protein
VNERSPPKKAACLQFQNQITAVKNGNSVPTKRKENIMSVEDKVKKIIAEKLSVDIAEVVPEASFVDDLGADSLDLVELIMSMEEAFDVDISDEDAEKLVTVKDAFDYIKNH